MGSSGGSQTAASFDPTVDLYELMVFSEGNISSPGALFPGFVGDAHIQAGEPGWLVFNIPITAYEVTGHQDVAEDGRTAFNPEATPKPETRVHLRINRGGNYYPLLSGTVVERVHDVASDSVSLKIVDDLYQLSKFSIIGRYTTTASGGLFFDPSKPCTFNENGWPDCIDDAAYGPIFAPQPRYGWVPTDTTEPTPGQASTRARSWRITDIITYLCNCFDESTTGFFNTATALDDDLKPTPLPEDWITFTSDISTQLTISSTDFASNSPTETERQGRPVHNYSCESKTLLLILNELAALAGPFMPYAYASEGKSKIMFLSLTPTLERTQVSIAPGVSSLQAGSLVESSEKWYGFSTIVGNPPVIERMVSTDCGTVTSTADANATSPSATSLAGAAMGAGASIRSGSLIPKWSAADEAAFIAYIIANSTITSPSLLPVDRAFTRATELYPFVFCAYGVSPEFNYLLGTKYATLATSLPHQPPQLQPYLVSGRKILYDASQSTGLGTWAPFEITVECFIAGTAPGDEKSTAAINATTNVWSNVIRSDGLQVSADGTYIMLPALRDAATHPTFRGDVSTLADSTAVNAIKANHIRLTIAMIPPLRIFSTDATDPNKIGGRMAPAIYPQFLAAPNSDYTEWLRIDSYPWGKQTNTFDATVTSTFGTDSNGKLPDKCTSGSELFSDVARIATHAKARNRRNNWIYAKGQLVTKNYEPGYSIGAKLSEVGNIEAGATVTSVTFYQAKQTVAYGFS